MARSGRNATRSSSPRTATGFLIFPISAGSDELLLPVATHDLGQSPGHSSALPNPGEFFQEALRSRLRRVVRTARDGGRLPLSQSGLLERGTIAGRGVE